MAQRVLIDKSIGYVAIPSAITIVDDEGKAIEQGQGQLTSDAVKALFSVLFGLATAFNGQILFGDGTPGSRAGNIFGQWVTLLTPSVADTEFQIDHGLGRIPVAILVGLSDTHCTIRTSSLGSWSGSKAYLKCSAASATLRLLLL